jgi:hypothetical protein
MALIALLGIALISAILWHRFLPDYWAASVGATLTTVIAFQIAVFVQLGHLDPYLLVAAITTTIPASIVSLLVGLPLRARRKQARSSTNAL